jgi:phage major head subunit gpT-like protein
VLELLSQDRLVSITNVGVEGTSSVVAAANRSNTFSGEYVPIVDERVSTFYWDLIDASKEPKPMVLFELMAPQPEPSRAQLNDPMVFEKDLIPFGGKADFGVGAGHWHTCYRGTGTA